jgi:serine/threonine protein phosphatase PrpC
VYLKDIGGHSPVGSCGIVCQPDVKSQRLTQKDLFLVIGSDGFFDAERYINSINDVILDAKMYLMRFECCKNKKSLDSCAKSLV